MKKICFSFLLALMTISALQAQPISSQKALQVARRFFDNGPRTKASSGDLELIWDGEDPQTKSDVDDNPAFYVFGRDGGGFVIVAGNARVRPVLAFSFTERFSVKDMPDNVKFWMERIKRYSRHEAFSAHPEVSALWDAFEPTKGERLEDGLITDEYMGSRTVQWDQDDPANLKCPKVDGESSRAVCGCVPLAISEIMTWFGHPVSGTGTVEGYSFKISQIKSFSIPSHELGTEYDWAGLQSLKTPMQFYAETNSELGQNLGQLVYDVGTILQVSYSVNGTGGNLEYLDSLSEHMAYSRSAIERARSSFPEKVWDQMLKDEVQQHPVYYSGTDWDAYTGHAYVVDGYGTYNASDLVFHFNFGWGGNCNGYYYSDYQTPEEPAYPSMDMGSYSSVTALFGFVPDPERTSKYLMEMGYYSEGGLSLSWENNQLKLTAVSLTNSGNASFTGQISLFRQDKNGIPQDEANYNNTISSSGFKPGYYYPSLEITLAIPDNLSLGDTYAMYFLPKGESDYIKVSNYNPAALLDEAPVFPAAFIRREASYNVGDRFYFRLANHDYTYEDAVWHITAPSGNKLSFMQSESYYTFPSAGKYKVEVETSQETIVAVIEVK